MLATKVIYIRTEEEFYELIKEEAKRNRRSINAEAQIMLEEAMLARIDGPVKKVRQRS